jgi:hypothetical protein
MANYFKNVDGVNIEMSDEEHAARVAEEKAYADGAVKREALREISNLENAITRRRMRDSILTEDGKKWLDDQEKLIAVERGKL